LAVVGFAIARQDLQHLSQASSPKNILKEHLEISKSALIGKFY
jgi:hypothetical protein